jgi:2-(1,2-epoxy-1,2-dihydrophenyl)acetyl-CoA isomerase
VSEDDPVLVHTADGVATVVLNRPERLNAISAAMANALVDRLHELAGDRDVRVVVLTGAGRAFCAGGDVISLAEAPDQPNVVGHSTREIMAISELLHGMSKPTIAAINGPCAGAGLSWAAAADLRYAATSAVFAAAFLRVGVSGDHGGIWSVTRAVGTSRARELFLLGERFTAEDALRIGLIHRVVPDSELRESVDAVAAQLAECSPAAVAAMKANLNDALDSPLGVYLDGETERFLGVSGSEEAKEAARAFLEKRAPRFGRGD